MSLHDQLLAAGAEFSHPKYLATVDGARCFVGEFLDGELRLTDQGRKLLADEPKTEDKPAKRSKKAAPVVESANELEGILDDLNLGE
jgi:hypothetical protein